MDNDTIFLYIIAAAALCFALINCIQFIMKRNCGGRLVKGKAENRRFL